MAAGLALALVLTGCGSGAVEVDPPDLSGGEAESCSELVDALPETLAGQSRRAVSPDDAPAAAWGDPAIVVTCGVPQPEAYDEFSSCIDIDGTGWFATDEALEDLSSDLVVTELTHRPRVQVVVPPERRGDDRVLAGLAAPVRQALPRESRCR